MACVRKHIKGNEYKLQSDGYTSSTMFSTSALCIALFILWNCDLTNSVLYNEPLRVEHLLQAPEQTGDPGTRARQPLDKRQPKQAPLTRMNNGW
ncbi:unnamed protein product [Dicrocoelium dendriticum]|nr:unnamed protein product [Dicrocoelium dendriticum]